MREESEVRMKATSIDNEPVDAGTEVVIERIEGDMAIVEKWSSVERRL
jgi:membrane protein implicated in regulation of membrane protease activity